MPKIECAHCQAEATVKRKWQKFCSEKCRWAFWQKRHPRSIELQAIESGIQPCYYCGLIADTVDHVPPLSVRPRLLALCGPDRFTFCEVPACKECNCGLGARSLFTLTERKRYIKAWLMKRYKKELALPEWTDAELAQLGPGLQDYVICQAVLAEVVRARLKF